MDYGTETECIEQECGGRQSFLPSVLLGHRMKPVSPYETRVYSSCFPEMQVPAIFSCEELAGVIY